METIGPYVIIIGICVIIIVSYFFNIISQRTNIPSVLLLIGLGLLIKQGMIILGVTAGNQLFRLLELLGIVGLILIVLEASLDLHLTKDKWTIVWKSFSIALLSLVMSTFAVAYILNYFIIADMFTSVLYAIPLSVMSSSIILPSVGGLATQKKEFMVYEGTFSDILGIMFFYFLIGNANQESAPMVVVDVLSNVVVTVVLSIVVAYGLVFIFQKITTQVRLFLLIAMLVMLYSVGKLFHLSSLLIILVFGLVLNNYEFFFRGKLTKFIHHKGVVNILKDLRLVTIESTFIVRTFFFVLFGVTITLASLKSYDVAIISISAILALYFIRFLLLFIFYRSNIFPELFIAPRGLITILLFFAIPLEHQTDVFDSGILVYVIIISCIIMAAALVATGKKVVPIEDMSFIYNPSISIDDKNSQNISPEISSKENAKIPQTELSENKN